MRNFFAGTHRRPTRRKAGPDEGSRAAAVKPGDVRRLNRHRGEVKAPAAGRVRSRWSRPVPQDVKSCRVTPDRAGRRHAAFPDPVPAPGTGQTAGAGRGAKATAALSTGEMPAVPGLPGRERRRLARLERKPTRARRGPARRGNVKARTARTKAREADRRKDRREKTSTGPARRFDVTRAEDLKVRNMTRPARGTAQAPGRNAAAKAGPNREIQRSGRGLPARRLQDKAPGRAEKTSPAYTSQQCPACGHVPADNRKSQAVFACTACGSAGNADVNAAKNTAAGHAVKARRGDATGRPMTREPQLLASLTGPSSWNPPPPGGGGCQSES
jgi:transposase